MSPAVSTTTDQDALLRAGIDRSLRHPVMFFLTSGAAWLALSILLGVISSTLNGEAVVKGRSLFAERVGDEVAASHVTLIDDPTNPKAYTATDVDGEGLAARRNVLIQDGVLQQFVHN